MQKYLKEVALFSQPFVKNDKQTVEQMLKEKNTKVTGFTLYVVGEGIEKKQDDFFILTVLALSLGVESAWAIIPEKSATGGAVFAIGTGTTSAHGTGALSIDAKA